MEKGGRGARKKADVRREGEGKKRRGGCYMRREKVELHTKVIIGR